MLAGAGPLNAAANQLAADMLPAGFALAQGGGLGGGLGGNAPRLPAGRPAGNQPPLLRGDQPGRAGQQQINVTINNPRGEPVEASIVRQLKNLAYLGVLQPALATA